MPATNPRNTATHKWCPKCSTLKERTKFYKSSPERDGLQTRCKACQNIEARERMRRHAIKHAGKPPENFVGKVCPGCEIAKPREEFYAAKHTATGFNVYCKPCAIGRHRKWRKVNPAKWNAAMKNWRDKNPERARDHGLKQRYGLPMGTYDTMLNAQNARCAICETIAPGGKGNFHVDHCHSTSEVRGLLCNNCNVLLGYAKDNPAVLSNAIKYLAERSRKGAR